MAFNIWLFGFFPQIFENSHINQVIAKKEQEQKIRKDQGQVPTTIKYLPNLQQQTVVTLLTGRRVCGWVSCDIVFVGDLISDH